MSSDKYERELRACAEKLQIIIPHGQVKHIGLLEVAAGIDALIHMYHKRGIALMQISNSFDGEHGTEEELEEAIRGIVDKSLWGTCK